MKASAYIGALVVVDGATVQCDCATIDVDATSILPKGGIHGMSVKASTPLGRWGGFMKASAYCGLVVMDVATVERDCATLDAEATSVLPEVANMACE